MERKISWTSGYYDEIELVYKKAKEDEMAAQILSELEEMALQEGRANSSKIRIGDTQLTPEMFDSLSEVTKEGVMCKLGEVGLAGFAPSMTEPNIIVTLSPQIPFVLGCTMFSILNRLEKVDGAYNALFPKAKLEIRAPLGGKKGLVKCETLILLLYPWLTVTETSTNQVAVTMEPNMKSSAASKREENTGSQSSQQAKEEKLVNSGAQNGVNKTLGTNTKQGFFARLFGNGKKKETEEKEPVKKEGPKPSTPSAQERIEKMAVEKERSTPVTDEELLTYFVQYFAPNKEFYSVPNSPKFNAYFNVVNAARLEMINNPNLFNRATGRTQDDLLKMINNPKPGITSMLVCGLIFLTGSYAVIKDNLYCVDFSEHIPNCIALYLLLIAERMPAGQRIQGLDTGTGTNPGALEKVISSLQLLDPDWKCTILY